MLDMIGKIQRTIARGVPVSKTVAEEVAHRQKCWGPLFGSTGLKVAAADGDGDGTEPASDASVQIIVEVGAPFLHAFIIPNYKASPDLSLLSS
jgi:hypothetical protein